MPDIKHLMSLKQHCCKAFNGWFKPFPSIAYTTHRPQGTTVEFLGKRISFVILSNRVLRDNSGTRHRQRKDAIRPLEDRAIPPCLEIKSGKRNLYRPRFWKGLLFGAVCYASAMTVAHSAAKS
jgi:hypothetical protein